MPLADMVGGGGNRDDAPYKQRPSLFKEGMHFGLFGV
jgi:hypothetical protein